MLRLVCTSLSKRWRANARINMLVKLGIAASLVFEWAMTGALADECKLNSAPDKFRYKEQYASKDHSLVDSGIVPTGFVELRNGPDVVHGIDVSKWQKSINFQEVFKCGGRFAYVRLSAGQNPEAETLYRVHWRKAKLAGLLVGPYHNLTLKDFGSDLSLVSDSELQNLVELNESSSRTQAKLFIARLKEVLQAEASRGIGLDGSYLGGPYLPIALDVSAQPQRQYGPTAKSLAGSFYTKAICAWIDEVTHDKSLSGQTLVIYTKPDIYSDYNLESSRCNMGQFPIWIAHRSRDGDSELNEKDELSRQAILDLCGRNEDVSRCKIHQYTSYGGRALNQQFDGLDMNRFYGTEGRLISMLQRALR